MSRQITGTLVLPDGSTLGAGKLTFIADITANNILEGTQVTTDVSATGTYDITLENSRYMVYLERSGVPLLYLGKISVNTDDPISLTTLLFATHPYIDPGTSQYIDARFAATDLALQESLAGYVPILDPEDDTPTNPDINSFSLLVIKRNADNIPTFDIQASWDECITGSGEPVEYLVSYEITTAGLETLPTTMVVTSNIAHITGVLLGATYQITIQARCATIFNEVSAGTVSKTVTVTNVPIGGFDLNDVVAIPGVGYIALRWTKPTNNSSVDVYVGTSDYYELDTSTFSNRIYSGKSSTCTYHVPLTSALDVSTPYYFNFIVKDATGEASAAVGPAGPYYSLLIDETSVGKIVAAGALTAQQLANDLDIGPNLAANTIAASKLAVLDLTNMVTNQNFTLGSPTDLVGWTYDNDPSNLANNPEGFITLEANDLINNIYTFPCSAGDKFYCAAKLRWTGSAGVGIDKGLQIVFTEEDGTEITSGYTTTNTTSIMTDDDNYDSTNNWIAIDGFAIAPATAKFGFIRVLVDVVLQPVSFLDIICRKGSAVMIANGEITADKINVTDLFAQTVVVGGQLKTSSTVGDGEGNGDENGVIVGANGIQLYDSAGNVVVDLDPNTGSASFEGDISSSSISASSISGGTITGSSISGVTGTFEGLLGKQKYASSTDTSSPQIEMDLYSVLHHQTWHETYIIFAKGQVDYQSGGLSTYSQAFLLDMRGASNATPISLGAGGSANMAITIYESGTRMKCKLNCSGGTCYARGNAGETAALRISVIRLSLPSYFDEEDTSTW